MRKLHKTALAALSTCHGNVTGWSRQITKSQNKHCASVSTLQPSDPQCRLAVCPQLLSQLHSVGESWPMFSAGTELYCEPTSHRLLLTLSGGKMRFCFGNSPKALAAEEGHGEAASSCKTRQALEILHLLSQPWHWRSFPPNPHYLLIQREKTNDARYQPLGSVCSPLSSRTCNNLTRWLPLFYQGETRNSEGPSNCITLLGSRGSPSSPPNTPPPGRLRRHCSTPLLLSHQLWKPSLHPLSSRVEHPPSGAPSCAPGLMSVSLWHNSAP